MAYENLEFLPALLKQPLSIQDLRGVLRSFQEIEATEDGPYIQQLPYYRWFKRLDTDQKSQFRTALQIFAAEHPENAAALTLATGVLMRIHASKPEELNTLRLLVSDFIKTCEDKDILFELGNIFRAIPEWEPLKIIARTALDHFEPDMWQTHIICDWIILANYRQLVKKFETNTLTDQDISIFEAEVDTFANKIGSNTKNIVFYRSVTATLRNQIEDAIDWILKAQKLPGKIIAIFQRIESFVPLSSLNRKPSEKFNTLNQTVVHHFKHEAGDEGALVVSSDKKYFNQYADKLLESYAYWNPGAVVHLHCVNFSLSKNEVEALENKFPLLINHSSDTRLVVIATSKLSNGYCAGARYIFLPLYLEKYKKVTVSDIDGVIRRPLSDLWEDGSTDIRICSKVVDPEWRSTRMLWEAVAAGSLAIPLTPENMEFSWMVSNYLNEQIGFCKDHNLRLFYTDQIALLLSYVASKDKCTFAPLSGLFKQSPSWQFSNTDMHKAKFQNAVNYKNRLR